MTTKSFMKEYDLTKTNLSEIEKEIESKCNDYLFSQNTIKCMSNTQCENKYIVNVVYEKRIKWIEVLIALIIFGYLIYYLVKIAQM